MNNYNIIWIVKVKKILYACLYKQKCQKGYTNVRSSYNRAAGETVVISFIWDTIIIAEWLHLYMLFLLF